MWRARPNLHTGCASRGAGSIQKAMRQVLGGGHRDSRAHVPRIESNLGAPLAPGPEPPSASALPLSHLGLGSRHTQHLSSQNVLCCLYPLSLLPKHSPLPPPLRLSAHPSQPSSVNFFTQMCEDQVPPMSLSADSS